MLNLQPSLYRQSGVYLIWLIIFVPILIGMLGFAVDVGFYLSEIKRAQTMADVAAMELALSEPTTLYDDPNSDQDLVGAAARALAYNGFTAPWQITVGDPVTKTPEPTYAQSAYFSTKPAGNYIGVTVTGKAPLFFAYWFKDRFPIMVHAVTRRGRSATTNLCPGIYGKTSGKVFDLKGTSKFLVQNGGIYVEGVSNSLYGSSSSVLSADWIEVNKGIGGVVGSFTIECITHPTTCPRDVSPDRLPPADPPALTCTTNCDKCIVENNIFKCGCTLQKIGGKDTWVCTSNPSPATNVIKAGKYTGGLKIINSNNVIMEPTGSTAEEKDLRKNLYFEIEGGNFEVTNSTVKGKNIVVDVIDPLGVNGITLTNSFFYACTSPYNRPTSGFNDTGCNNESARLYAHYFFVDTSTIKVTKFDGDQDEAGSECGRRKAKRPTIGF